MRKEERKRLKAKEKNRFNLITREFKNLLSILREKEREYRYSNVIKKDDKLFFEMHYYQCYGSIIFTADPLFYNLPEKKQRNTAVSYSIELDDDNKLQFKYSYGNTDMNQVYHYLLTHFFNSDHSKLIVFLQSWAIDLI
jgi:hypothetical protein